MRTRRKDPYLRNVNKLELSQRGLTACPVDTLLSLSGIAFVRSRSGSCRVHLVTAYFFSYSLDNFSESCTGRMMARGCKP